MDVIILVYVVRLQVNTTCAVCAVHFGDIVIKKKTALVVV